MTWRSLTTALLATCCFFAFAAASSAQTICVDTLTPQLTGCDTSVPYDAAGFDSAVDSANAGTGFEGEDTVKIAPGTLTVDANVSAITQPGFGAVHIVGAGRDSTKLQLDVGLAGFLTGLIFDATAQPSSSISDLSVEVPAQVAGIVGVNAKAGTISRTLFTVRGDSESSHRGLITSGSSPTTVTDSDFELIGGDSSELSAITADGDLVVSKVTIRGASPFLNGQRGILTSGINSNVMIDESKFENLDPALRVEKGTVKFLDSLVLNPLADLDTVIRFASTGSLDAALITSGVTIVGARTGVNISTTTPSPNVDINNSIVQTTGAGAADIACTGSSGFEPDVTMRVSILSTGAPASFCHYTEVGTIDRIASPPTFAGAGDYRPAAGSPQIDAGEVVYPTMMGDPSPLVDLAGATRLVDGDGDGTARLDIGAYEYQQPSIPITKPTPPTVALALRFGKVVGKVKITKKPKTFSLTTAKKKPRLPVTSNLATPVELTLARSKAGYVSGAKCVTKKPASGKKKRCDIPLKGKLALQLPAGTSYLTFSGKWNKKKLKPGKYALALRAPGAKDAIKSVLNLIR